MGFFDWSDWFDWLVAGLCALLVAAIVGIVMLAISDARSKARFMESCPGKSYQALVMDLGSPTSREPFPDGTEVVCWKEFHPGTTTYVQNGKVMVPIQNPPHVSGWKAIMRDGVCVHMEKL